MHYFSISLSVLVACAEGWSHESKGDDWNMGICLTGKKQSPINLDSTTAKRSDYPDPNGAFEKFASVAGKAFTGNVQKGNKTHGFKVNLTPEIDLKDGYSCSQWHCHFKSEHEVDGMQFEGECHLVCHNKLIATGLGPDHLGSPNPDALRVFGVLIKKDDDAADNQQFDSILEAYKIASDEGTEDSVVIPNPDAKSLYRYWGSLTTPECQEIVHWTVFAEPMVISANQWKNVVNSFTKSIDRGNFRNVQELNGRTVVIYENQETSSESQSTTCSENIYLYLGIATIVGLLIAIGMVLFDFLKWYCRIFFD